MTSNLDAALWYMKKGFSVIPAKKDKKPFIKWADFQTIAAPEVQIREWWAKWPSANIGLVTGKISGIIVLDADSEEGKASLQEFLSDSVSLPTVKTPHGYHFYFQWVPGLSNGVRVLHDCDIRSDGGYVVAPPSTNGSAKAYVWMDGLHIKDNPPIKFPSILKDVIEQQSFQSNNNSNTVSSSLLYSRQNVGDKDDNSTTVDDTIPEGSRDDTLFTLANYLVRGGMPKDKILFYMNFFASNCSPPFPEKEVEIKIKSAFERSKKRSSNFAAEIKEWVLSSSGVFLSSECPLLSSMSSREEKKAISKVFSRLVDVGIIERVGDRNGMFRKIDRELNIIDIFNVNSEFLDIHYPLSLHELFKTMPKNIIVIAGTPNVGKTAFMLNVAAMNMNRGMRIRYFTSEMGGMELSNRCKMFEPDIPLSFWKDVEFCDHSSGFANRIDPDGLNIIDYLEIPNEFWMVGLRLKEIYDRLDRGVAVVALQKKFGQQLGRGAEFSLEKPRLYVSLEANPPEGNIAEIMKCKNFARDDINPNHMECVFNVIKGVKIQQRINWSHKNASFS